MVASKAHLEGNKKYQSEKVDRIVFYVPKGEKDNIKEAARAAGMTTNQFIVDAINNKISATKAIT